MAAPYMVRISSQKGGIGKTTMSANLAATLRLMGHRVLIVDADYVTPVVAFPLGLEEIDRGFKSVMLGRAKLTNSISIHAPTGLHVLWGEMVQKMFEPSASQITRFDQMLRGTSYNFIIVDTPPGFSK